jgi:hypothetical protein
MVLRESWRAELRLFRIPGDGPLARPAEPAPPAAAMTVSRLVAPSADGTGIPITLLGPANLAPPWPVVLYGYGAYGVPVDPYYTPFRVSLLDRGVGFAVAHLRGGGELGPAWHRAGQRQHQLRTVEDYLACGRHLIAAGWCLPAGLVARCRSAGAAAVGAALNQDPDLFAAAVLEVPFVDCLRTLSDPAASLAELPARTHRPGRWLTPIPEARTAGAEPLVPAHCAARGAIPDQESGTSGRTMHSRPPTYDLPQSLQPGTGPSCLPRPRLPSWFGRLRRRRREP